MEIKAKLNKPYSDKQRADFLVENNHNLGYEIQETEDALLAVYNEPTIEEQNEAIRQTREQLYIQTSDKLKADYDEAVARGAENAEELKTAWLESKDKIREENPYIVESVEEVMAEAEVEPVEETNNSDGVLSEAPENKGQSESETEEVI